MGVRKMRKIVIDKDSNIYVSKGDPAIRQRDKEIAELLGTEVKVVIEPADEWDIGIAKQTWEVRKKKKQLRRKDYVHKPREHYSDPILGIEY